MMSLRDVGYMGQEVWQCPECSFDTMVEARMDEHRKTAHSVPGSPVTAEPARVPPPAVSGSGRADDFPFCPAAGFD